MGSVAISLFQTNRLAAGLSFVAGLIHLVVFPEHLEEWWGYGLFFLIVAVAQMAYALVLLGTPSRGVYLAGIFGNLAIISLYLVTRTLGIPILGPEAGEVEHVAAIDIASKFVELLLVFVLAAMLASRDGDWLHTHRGVTR